MGMKHIIWRQAVLIYYGEEHLKPLTYNEQIENGLQPFIIAKRKVLNPLKLISVPLKFISLVLQKWSAHLNRRGNSNIAMTIHILKKPIIDLPLAIWDHFACPANTIIRPLKNLYQESTPAFLFVLLISGLGGGACYLLGGLTFSLGGGSLIALISKKIFATEASISVISTLTTCSDAVIATGLGGDMASMLTERMPHRNSATRKTKKSASTQTLFNSSKRADTFRHDEITKTHQFLSFWGADPDNSNKTNNDKRDKVNKMLNQLGQPRSRVKA